jgi:hypothetical protein
MPAREIVFCRQARATEWKQEAVRIAEEETWQVLGLLRRRRNKAGRGRTE